MSKKTRQTRRQRIARNLRQRSRRALQVERLETRNLLAGDLGMLDNQLQDDNRWHNEVQPYDVNGDGEVTSGDVLIIINGLSYDQDLGVGAALSGMRPDVNNDGLQTPADALIVINVLNSPEAEAGTVMNITTKIFERPANYPFDGGGNRVQATNEITSIVIGRDFVVKLFVEDVRMMGNREGVFAAYFDVNFDNPAVATLIQSLPGVVHPQSNSGESTPFLHNQQGSVFGQRAEPLPSGGTALIDTDNNGSLDQIDVVGSFAGNFGTGPGEFVLVEFAMTASQAGTLTIIAEPTTEDTAFDPNDFEESPAYDAGIFGQNAPVCPSASTVDPCMGEMEFFGDSITVVQQVAAVNDNYTAVEDGGPQTLNVLSNDIEIDGGTLTITNPVGTPSLGGSVVNNGNNLTYTPAMDANGTETFTYTISNDQGDTSTGTVTVDISAVNDAPITSAPSTSSVDEDSSLVFSGGVLSVSDVDADAGSGLQVDVMVNNGTLTVASSSATVTNDGTGNVRIDGSVAEVNAALNGLTYLPASNFNGSDILTLDVDDKGNAGSGGQLSDSDSVNITINPINDGPINSVPGSQNLFNTEILSFVVGTDVIVWSDPFTIADVDADALEVTLTVNEGTLQFGSGGTPSNSLTASGSKVSINSQLGTLIYDPVDDFIGNATLTMTTSDLGNTGAAPPAQTNPLTDTSQVTISVAPPKAPFAAADFFDLEEDPNSDLSFNLSELLANDLVPLGSTSPLVLKNINAMSPSASPFTTAQGGSLSFDEGNGTFTYTPVANFFGLDTFTYTIDLVDTAQGDGESIGTVNIDVQPINDGPINSVPGPLSIDEDNTLSLSGGMISVVDIDAGSDGVTVTLTVTSGTLNVPTSGGGTISNNDSRTVSLDGTVTQVNDALDGLTYKPDDDFFGSDVLSVNTNDNGNTGGATGDPTGSNPLSDLDTVNITIQPINDGPVLTIPGSLTFITDFDNILSLNNGNAFMVSDVDAGSDDVQFDLSIGEGSLTVLDTSNLSSASGNGTNSLTLMGSVSALNAALANGVNYVTSVKGDKILTATVNDLGKNGGIAGDPNAVNPLSDSASIDVDVLDFVPSNIAGSVYFDKDNDGNKVTDETGVTGVTVILEGTTFRNTAFRMEVLTNRDGGYLFPNLEPGDYTLTQVQPANLKSGTNSFSSGVVATGNDNATVTIPIAGDVQSLNNNFAVRGLTTPFISMYNLSASQFQRSGALLSTDGITDWTAFLGSGWENYSNPSVDLMTMTLTVTDGNGTVRSVDLRSADPNRHGRTQMDRVTIRTMGDNQVIRLNGSAADFGLAGGGGGEGEGELADVQAANSMEMYAQSVDEFFSETV